MIEKFSTRRPVQLGKELVIRKFRVNSSIIPSVFLLKVESGPKFCPHSLSRVGIQYSGKFYTL